MPKKSKKAQFNANEASEITSALPKDTQSFIIGGQALNLWVSRYRSAKLTFSVDGPFTSKDVDYFGNQFDAAQLAAALQGNVSFPSDDDATASTAHVTASFAGKEVGIDFLDNVLGVKRERLKRRVKTLDAPLISNSQQTITLRVMHPVHCMQSRIYNVVSRTIRRNDETALRQLRAAPTIVIAFISEALDNGQRKEATQSLREIADYLITDFNGRNAHERCEIDPLDILIAFCDDNRLDPRYRAKTLRPLIEKIEKQRRAREKRRKR